MSVIGNLTIGRGSIVGAGSLVNKDIPPFSVAVGSPCKVIKRYDFGAGKWVGIDEYDFNNDSLIPTEEEYANKLKQNFPNVIIPFVACGKNKGDLF